MLLQCFLWMFVIINCDQDLLSSNGVEYYANGNGISVSTDADTIVVGAQYQDAPDSVYGTNDDSGAAYVFVRNETTWTQQVFS
jgi:hypothetical protein